MARRDAVLDLSVVIASFNTREMTRRCLDSILSQTRTLRYEIIVVDNASTDGSTEMIRDLFPSVRLIRNTENRGFAAAQNAGLARARGRYLLVLNSDVLFVGNTARRLVDHFERSAAAVGVVGPKVRNVDGTLAPSARRAMASRPMIVASIVNRHFNFKRWLPEEQMRRHAGALLSRWHDNYASHDAIRQVDFVDGMCALFKRQVLEQVGLFDEQYFFDAEIVDLSQRIRARGWRIELYPAAQVIHVGRSSRRIVSSIVLETHRSELIYYSMHAPELVPFVRRVTVAVVFLKGLLMRARMMLTRDRQAGRAALDVCRRILDLCRRFDPASAAGGARVPRLPAHPPA